LKKEGVGLENRRFSHIVSCFMQIHSMNWKTMTTYLKRRQWLPIKLTRAWC